jgi:hypothetical protein
MVALVTALNEEKTKVATLQRKKYKTGNQMKTTTKCDGDMDAIDKTAAFHGQLTSALQHNRPPFNPYITTKGDATNDKNTSIPVEGQRHK